MKKQTKKDENILLANKKADEYINEEQISLEKKIKTLEDQIEFLLNNQKEKEEKSIELLNLIESSRFKNQNEINKFMGDIIISLIKLQKNGK